MSYTLFRWEPLVSRFLDNRLCVPEKVHVCVSVCHGGLATSADGRIFVECGNWQSSFIEFPKYAELHCLPAVATDAELHSLLAVATGVTL